MNNDIDDSTTWPLGWAPCIDGYSPEFDQDGEFVAYHKRDWDAEWIELLPEPDVGPCTSSAALAVLPKRTASREAATRSTAAGAESTDDSPPVPVAPLVLQPADFNTHHDYRKWWARYRHKVETLEPTRQAHIEFIDAMDPDWFCTLTVVSREPQERVLKMFRALQTWIARRSRHHDGGGVRGIYVLELHACGTRYHLHFFLKGARPDLDPEEVVKKWARLNSGSSDSRYRRCLEANKPAQAVRSYDPALGANAYISDKIVTKEEWWGFFDPSTR